MSIEPEINVFLSWIQQEMTVDVAVVGKLWDGVTWEPRGPYFGLSPLSSRFGLGWRALIYWRAQIGFLFDQILHCSTTDHMQVTIKAASCHEH